MDKKLVYHILYAIGLYLAWYLIYVLWLAPDGRLDTWLNNNLAINAYHILKFFGYNTCVEGSSLCVNVVATVWIGRGCNGLEIYYIFSAFMVFMPGKWWSKLLYSIAGVVFIYLSNIIRIVLLAIDRYKDINLFNFNHKYTYVFIIYTLVFSLWILWILKFAPKRVAVQ